MPVHGSEAVEPIEISLPVSTRTGTMCLCGTGQARPRSRATTHGGRGGQLETDDSAIASGHVPFEPRRASWDSRDVRAPSWPESAASSLKIARGGPCWFFRRIPLPLAPDILRERLVVLLLTNSLSFIKY